jgi:hypothetical protein
MSSVEKQVVMVGGVKWFIIHNDDNKYCVCLMSLGNIYFNHFYCHVHEHDLFPPLLWKMGDWLQFYTKYKNIPLGGFVKHAKFLSSME